jgi:hypothetical protein
MKRTLLISVAAVALAAGSTVALSQGSGGGNTPMANPSAPSSGQDTAPGTKATPSAKGAQERAIPEKQKSTQQAPGTVPEKQKSSEQAPGMVPEKQKSTEQAPATGQEKQKSTQQGPAADQEKQKSTQQVPATSQQAPQQQGQAAPSQQPGQATPQRQQQQTQSPPAGGAKQGAAERPMTSSNVSLTTEQKTTIRQTVLTSSAPRVTNVTFDIKIGTVVPRTVRVAPLPVTLIEIQPSWRGYMYFVYNDEIIVVEPGTLRIVAVIEV